MLPIRHGSLNQNGNVFPTLSNSEKKKIENFENFSRYPSSFNKAVKESILWENNSIASSSFQTIDKLFGADRFANRGKKLFLEKTNIRKNQFPMYSSFEKENVQNIIQQTVSTEEAQSKIKKFLNS